MELPSIESILANVSGGKEYFDAEAQIQESIRELESLDLPNIDNSPPNPPRTEALVLKEISSKKKKIKAKKKKIKALTSFQILPSDPKIKPALVSTQVDTSALERVLAGRKATSAVKPYEIVNPISSSSCSDDEVGESRIVLEKTKNIQRNSAWREDSLKILLKNSKQVKITQSSNKEKILQKPRKNILAYMENNQLKDQWEEKETAEKIQKINKFDGEYLETFFPVEKLKKARQDNLPGLKAFSRYYTFDGSRLEWSWKPCLVVDYDTVNKKFLMEWDGSTSRKYVTRLNVLFEGESKELFFQRIETAIISKDSAEEAKKYYESIMNVDMPPFGHLSKKTKIAIVSRIGMPISKDQLPTVASCLKEIEEVYDFSMKKAYFELKNGTPKEISSIKSERFAHDAVSISGAAKSDITVSLTKNVSVASRVMAEYMLNANPSFQKAIIEILAAIETILPPSKRFFMFPFNNLIDPEKFADKAKSHSECAQAILVNEWPAEILRIIDSILGDYLCIKDSKVSEKSKTRVNDFFKLVNTIMSTQLQNLVVESYKNFLRFFDMDLEVCQKGVGKAVSEKSRYKIFKSSIFIVPYRFVIHVTLKVPKGKGFKVLRDIKNVPVIKIRPENEIVTIPKSFNEFKNFAEAMLLLPLKSTKLCVPTVETVAICDSHRSGNNWIQTLDPYDPLFILAPAEIESSLKTAWLNLERQISCFKKYMFLAQEDLCAYLEDNNELESFEEVATRIVDAKNELARMSLEFDLRPLYLDFSSLVQALNKILSASIEKISITLADKIIESCDFLDSAYKALDAQISVDPGQDVQKWKEMSDKQEQSEHEFEDYSSQISNVNDIWDLMYKLRLRISNTLSEKYWNTYKWPNIIREHMSYCKSRLEDSYYQIINQIKIDSEFIISSHAAYRLDVKSMNISDIERTDDMYSRVEFLKSRLKKIQVLSESVQTRCSLLNIDLSFSPDVLNQLFNDFAKYEKLWSFSWDIRQNLQKWTQSLFIDLNADFVISKAIEWTKVINDLLSLFHSSNSSLKVVHSLKVRLDDFSRNTTIIKALRNSALREHHWDQIAKIIGFSLHDFSGLRLRQVMDLDLEMIQDILLNISDQATREYKIEVAIDEIRAGINSDEFSIESKGSCVFITDGDRAISCFENSIIKSETLLDSPDSECLASKISQWINKLKKAENMLLDLMELQKIYLALLPAFESISSLAKESEIKAFTWVTKFLENWGEILSKNHKFVILIIRNDMHEGICSSISRLETTKHAVTQLADEKRSKFPRFYFLSDLEVMKVICSESDITSFNIYVHKCFPKIKSLISHYVTKIDPSIKVKKSFLASRADDMKTKKRWAALKVGVAMVGFLIINSKSKPRRSIFETAPKSTKEILTLNQNDDNTQITNRVLEISHVEGFSDEKLKLVSPIEVFGEIEVWLELLDQGIKKSIFNAVSSLTAKGLSDLLQWLIQYPLQICSLALSILMSKDTSLLIKESSPKAYNQTKLQLTKLSQNLVNDLDGYKSRNYRHANEFLISQIHDYSDYIDRLKNKDENDENLLWSYMLTETDIIIESMKWSYLYGMEYYGADTRLVLVPHWLRVFSNLMQNIFFGTANILLGSSGHMKIGLLKELASIFGYKFMILDTSAESSAKKITDLMQSAILTQSWIFLKNFDCGDQKVLSVVNHFLALSKKSFTIQTDSELNPEAVLPFTGVKLNLSSQRIQPMIASLTAVSIENFDSLHDQIRLSFRPISISIPPIEVFAHFRLRASGFKEYQLLSEKFGDVFKSVVGIIGWKNFKTGIRLVMKILETAAIQRFDFQTKGNIGFEGQVLASAICLNIEPILSESELVILNDILKVAFPDFHPSNNVVTNKHWLGNSIDKMKLSFIGPYVEKIDAIYEALGSNQLVVVLGEPFSGKTSGIKMLQSAISKIGERSMLRVSLNEYHIGSLACKELAGHQRDGSWGSGVFEYIISKASSEAQKTEIIAKNLPENQLDDIFSQVGYSWILLHGEPSAEICDYLTYLIFNADSRFENHYTLSSSTRLLLEVNNLNSASPSFVTRFSIINMGSYIETDHIFKHSIGIGLPAFIEGHDDLLDLIFQNLINPAISFVNENIQGCVHDVKALVRNLSNLFTSFLNYCGSESYDQFIVTEQKTFLVSQALLSVIWTFGMVVNRSDSSFDSFCRSVLFIDGVDGIQKNSENCNLECLKSLPDGGTVFDYFFESRLWSWQHWDVLLPKNQCLPPQNMRPGSEIIFTPEIVRYSYFSRVLLESNHRFVVAGTSGTGKSTLLHACLREDNFPNFKNKIKCNVDPSYNSDKFRRFVLKFFKDNEHRLDQSCLKNQRLILFVDDLESISADNRNSEEFFSLLKMLFETGKWPTENPSIVKNLSGMAVCASLNVKSISQTDRFSRISDFFHYFEIDDSYDRLQYIVTSILDPSFSSTRFIRMETTAHILKMTLLLIDKFKLLFTSDILRPYYSFTMKDVVRLMKGLVVQMKKNFTIRSLLEIWRYQTELIFMDHLSSEPDIAKFKVLQVESVLNFFPTIELDIFSIGIIHPPGIDREEKTSCLDDYCQLNIPVPTVSFDESSISNVQLEIKAKFQHLEKEKLHKGTIVDAIKISSKIVYNNLNVILVGNNLDNQIEITELSAYFGNFDVFKFSKFSHNSSSSIFDIKATWDMMLKSRYVEILNSGRFQILFFKFKDLEYSWQWDDLRIIFDESMPVISNNGQGSDHHFDTFSVKSGLLSKMLKVIITMESSAEFDESLIYYPFLSKCASIHWIHPLNSILTSSIVHDILGKSFFSFFPEIFEQNIHIADLFFSIYQDYFFNPSKTWCALKDSLPSPFEQFCSMTKSFKRIYSKNKPLLDLQFKKFQSAIFKIEEIMEILSDIELYFYKCRKESQTIHESVEDFLKKIEIEREVIDKAKKELRKDQERIEKATEEINYCSEKLLAAKESELLKYKPSIRAITSLNKLEFAELRNALLNIPDTVGLSRIFLSLLNYECKPGDMPLDCIRRLFNDSKLLQMFVSFDPSSVMETSIEKIKQCIQTLDKSSLKSITPINGWFDAILKYHNEMETHKPLKSMLGVLYSLKETALPSVKHKEDELFLMENEFASLKADFDRQMKKNEESTTLLREAEKVYNASLEIRQSILNYKKRLKESLGNKEKEKRIFFHNSVISAAFMTLLAPLSQAERIAYLNRWFSISQSLHIPTLNPSEYSFSQFISGALPSDTLVGCDLLYDSFLMDNFYISKELDKYPVFYDPYGISIRWIMGLDHDSRIEVLHSKDHDISQKLIQAALKGTRVILEVHGLQLCEFLEDFITNSQSESFRVEHDGSLKPIDSNFKVYIIVSEPLEFLYKYSWLKRCTLIYCSLDQTTAQSLIFEHLLSLVFKKEKDDFKKIDSEAASLRNRHDFVANRSAEFVLKIKKEDLSHGDLYRNIIENDELTLSIMGKIEISDEQEQKKAEKTAMIKKLSKPMAEIFFSLEKLTLLSLKNYNGFRWFLDLCALAGRQLISFDGHNLRSCISQMLVAVFNYVQSGLNMSELAVWSLELALISCKHILEIPVRNLEEYVQFLGGKDIGSSSIHKTNLFEKPNWISDNLIRNWERLSRWHKFKPIMESFSYYLRKCNKKADTAWENLSNAENPLKLTHPTEFANLSAIDKLIIVYVLRPDSLHLAVQNLFTSIIPPSSIEAPLDPIHSGFRFSSISAFIWIINEGLDNIVNTIKRMASEKLMTNATTFLNLDDKDVINDLSNILLDSIRRGRWLVLTGCDRNASALYFLDYHFSYLMGTLSERNQNFRLWLISKPFEEMPISISQRSIKIYIPRHRSLRSYIYESFSLSVENNIPASPKMQSAYRRVLFSFLLSVSFFKSSRGFQIDRLNNPIHFNDDEIIRALKLFRKVCIDFGDEVIDQKDLLQKFQNLTNSYVLTSQSLDPWDVRMICSLFTRFYNYSTFDTNHNDLPSFKTIYEKYAKSDMKKFNELIKTLPEDGSISPSVYGLDDNARHCMNTAFSKDFLNCFRSYQSLELDGPFKFIESPLKELKELCECFLNDIKMQSTGCFQFKSLFNTSKRSIKVTSKRLHLFNSKPSKFMEHVLRYNIESYRTLTCLIVSSLDLLISMSSGSSPRFKHYDKTISEIQTNQIPSEWLKSGKCYLTSLKLDEFMKDFPCRLKFVNSWYSVRQNPNLVNKGCLIIYDITKMFCPKGFLEALRLDYCTISKDSTELIDLEISILASKPSLLPEKGAYVSGLNLVGASWDFAKGVLRPGKLCEYSLEIPCVWIQPILRQEGKFKNLKPTQKLNRNGTKFECPFYIYKPKPGIFRSQYMDIFVTSFYISSMESDSVWIDKNVHIACEL